jgi:FkbM family methyltransferase
MLEMMVLHFRGKNNRRIFQNHVTIVTPYGHLLLSHGDIAFVFSVIWEIYFLKVYAMHRRYVPRKADVIVDAGSHLGLYTLWASFREPKIIVALEPDPRNFECLLRTIRANHMKNVLPLNAALGDQNGSVLFLVSNRTTESKVFDPHRDFGKVIAVKTMTLGRLMELTKLPRIDVLKMDIEGSELTVIKECFHLLSGGVVDRLVMEVHGNAEELIETIRKANFVIDCSKWNNKELGVIGARYVELDSCRTGMLVPRNPKNDPLIRIPR